MKNRLLKIAISLIAVISLALASATLLIGCGKKKDSPGDSSSGGDKTIVKISAETAAVAEFETIKLSATVENGDETVKWSTSDGSVATVDRDGLVLGVKTGRCNIIAMSGKAMAICALTVTDSIYAPVIKTADKITVENGNSYVGKISVLFRGEDVTERAKIEWSLAGGYEQVCNVVKGNGTVTFAAKSLGEAVYYVSATFNGIYVNKSVSVKVIEPIATVVPDGEITVGDDGYELKLFTLAEAGRTEMPLSFTAYYGGSVVKNAVIKWDLDSERYDPDIAEITGANGNYIVKKVSAGTTDIIGAYRTPNGKNITVSIKVIVEKAVKTLDIRPEIEVEDLKPVTLPDSFNENVLSLTLDGVNVYSSVSGKNVVLNKDKLPKTADKLGAREMILSTADVEYTFTADIYTLIISNKAEFDQMRSLARANGDVSNTGVLDGYFVLNGNIEYNAGFVSLTDSGEIWTINNKLGGAGWNDPSKYGFRGVFDGRGYNVNGITVKAATSGRESGGIFGFTGNNAVIKNVSFTNAGVEENNGFICSYGGWMECEMQEFLPDGFEIRMMRTPYVENVSLKKDGEYISCNYSAQPDYMLVPAKAKNKEGGKKFLAFLQRDDILKQYTKDTGSVRPFVYDYSEGEYTKFNADCFDICKNSDYSYFEYSKSPLWLATKVRVFNTLSPYTKIRSGELTAAVYCANEYNYVKDNWAKWKKEAGM